MRQILLCSLLFLVGVCHARSSVGVANPLFKPWTVRGGSTETFRFGSRTPPKQNKNPFSSTQNGFKKDDQDVFHFDEKSQTKEMLNSFLTRDSRNTFIARVYGILAGQLMLTGLSILLFGTRPDLRNFMFVGNGAIAPVISLLISTAAWAVMCISTNARRESPLKWQLLLLFTLGEAISVGFVSSFYHFKSVLSAMMSTGIATAAVSLYTALQNNAKYDLTQWGAGLSSCGVIFLVYGIIGMLQTFGIIPSNFLPYNDIIYSVVGAVLFSFYLAHHTKLIVAGKHAKYQMNEKDYVFGAMTLYNDIINMFIYILRIIGEDRDR